jgi:hypothetical protein
MQLCPATGDSLTTWNGNSPAPIRAGEFATRILTADATERAGRCRIVHVLRPGLPGSAIAVSCLVGTTPLRSSASTTCYAAYWLVSSCLGEGQGLCVSGWGTPALWHTLCHRSERLVDCPDTWKISVFFVRSSGRPECG